MQARGGETGGASITDALKEFEARGFTGQFMPHEGGLLECLQCHASSPADTVDRRSFRRVEGVSDPADMCEVDALVCPSCGERGTAVFAYGMNASPEEAEVLALLRKPRTRSPHPQMSSDTQETTLPETPYKDAMP